MTTGRHIERAPNRIGSELTTAEMSLGALSCEYVMDVWRVWHVFLLEPPVAAAGSSLEPSAAHMLLIACRRRTQTSSAARGRPAGNGGAIIIGPLAAGGSLRLAAVGGRAAKRTRWWIRLSARATFCGSDRPADRPHAGSYGGEPVLKLPNKKISNIPILLHRLLELYILSKEQVVRASSCGYSLRYQCFY